MRPIITRRLLYGWILAFGICQCILSAFTSPVVFYDDWWSGNHYDRVFQGLSAGVALVTWIWASVLLAYNNQPQLIHPLTKSKAHFISFVVLALVWIAIGIMILSQIPFVCRFAFDDQGLNSTTCGLTATTGALGLVIAILCAWSALFVYLKARSNGGLWKALLATDVDDSKHRNKIIRSRALDIRIAFYSLTLFFAIVVDVLAPLTLALVLGSDYEQLMVPFTALASGFALATLIWTSVLLAYNDRPNSGHPLTRASAHFYSVVAYGVCWLAIGIMLATQLKFFCTSRIFEDQFELYDEFDPLYCGMDGTITALAFTISLFSWIEAAVIYYANTRKGSLSENVAQYDTKQTIELQHLVAA